MDLGIRGRVALVAASSRGLGRAIASELAAEGVNLVLCARDQAPLDAAADEIRAAHSVEVLSQTADVTREEEVQALVGSALYRFHRLDILVANCGGPRAGGFSDLEPRDWQQGLELNLISTMLLARAAVPLMRRDRWGRIVAVTSISVKQPIAGLMLSNISRLGVLGFAKTLAHELGPEGITVNVVCPGYTRTDRVVSLARETAAREGLAEGEVVRRWTETIPMGRLGEPEELAALVAFLVSERASYITGVSIQVDGGWVRGPF
jgi:3-oxoacyl-[acyl-carrier protein] reductase